MSAFMELGATSAFICTAATSLGIGGYSNTKVCLDGVFKKKGRHHQREHHLDPPHHDELVNCPLKKDNVSVKMNNKSVGNRGVEFNGEILSIAPSAAGSPEPILSLGECDIRVSDCRVVATPPALPTVELSFSNQREAQRWAKEFKEASLVGPPQVRIQELIEHSLKVEKHVLDLRRRSGNALEVDKQNHKLKKEIRLLKCGFASADGGDRTPAAALALSSWFTGSMTAEKTKMQEEITHQRAELKRAHSDAERLKNHVKEHACTNSLAGARWRSMAQQLVQLYKDSHNEEDVPKLQEAQDAGALEPKAQQMKQPRESRTAEEAHRFQEAPDAATVTPKAEQPAPQPSEDSERTQDATPSSTALEPKFDPKRETKMASPRTSPFAVSRTVPRQVAQENEAKQERIAQALEQRFRDIENRLSYSRQISEESVHAGYTGYSTQPNPALKDDAIATQPAEVNAFKSLEERIRSHQMLVNQDCDVLQQAMRAISRDRF